jgi:arylsulfatase A-like enzyme
MRPHFKRLLGLPLLAALAALMACVPAGGEAAPPNVLLILTDDQGWGDVGRHGNEQIDTPVLDALHDASVRFDRFYVSPVCAPTRAALLTGRYPVRTGVTGVTQRYEVMRANELTLAEVFRDAGYATGCFGKWHNGQQYPNHPLGQGFDEFFGFCGGVWNNYFDATLEHNGEEIVTHGYITDVLTDSALAFIESHRDEPFLCYVPYNAPHTPWQVPDRYFDKYAERGLPATTASAYGMVENIDDNVGRLLASLDQHGLRGNTIVVFLTDNGPNSDRYNGGMRGRKGSVHEGGVRVPCFLSWPGRLEPGAVTQIAAHVDLLPTLAELCGLEVPPTRPLPLDGVSLVPLLSGASPDVPANLSERRLFTWRPTHDRQGRLVERGAVRTGPYLFVRERGQDQLFDLQQDPQQKTDIANARPQILQELRSAWETWHAEAVPDTIPRTTIPVGHAVAPRTELPAVESLSEGNPRFHNTNGYSHDWVTDWTSPDDRIWWELDVASAGEYEVTLSYACGADDVGSQVQLTARLTEESSNGNGDVANALTFTISKPFDTGTIARPERDLSDGPRWMREFRMQNVGRLRLPAGRVRLQLRALGIPGDSVCELDGLRLRRMDNSSE